MNKNSIEKIRLLVISDYRDIVSARPEAQLMIGLSKMGLDVHIMSYPDAHYRQLFINHKIKFIDFHPIKKLNRTEINRIKDYLISEKIDVIHLFNSKAIINGIQAAKNLNVKIVLYRGFTGNVHWYDPFAYLKYLNRNVDAIFCNSDGVSYSLRKQIGFKKNKAITIYKGHNPSWYENITNSKIKTELSIPENALVLCNVSNNRRMKGISYLLEAMNKLSDDLEVHLVLVGNNMDSKQNLKLIQKGNKQDRIHILGFRNDVLEIVKACDVFVFPSIYGEGMPKAVMEAMFLGKAVIATDIPGNNELVIHNESGLLIAPKDSHALSKAILKMVHNYNLSRRLGANAIQRMKTIFHIDHTVKNINKLYRDLLQD